MRILVNGEAREVAEGLTLGALLEELRIPGERIAVELNRSVVRRRDWADVRVGDGDRLEIVHFVGGG